MVRLYSAEIGRESLERLVYALQIASIRNVQRVRELEEQIIKKEEEVKKMIKQKETTSDSK